MSNLVPVGLTGRPIRPLSLIAIILAFNSIICTPAGASNSKGAREGMALTSSAFTEGGMMPKKFTSDGSNVSPELRWSGAPSQTKSFTLICDDPDAPRGLWVHWVLYDVPSGIEHLDEGVSPKGKLPAGAKQGTNSFFKIGYGGPSPPPGKAHRYFFKLFALDQSLDLKPGISAIEVQKAMSGHILGETKLMAKYSR